MISLSMEYARAISLYQVFVPLSILSGPQDLVRDKIFEIERIEICLTSGRMKLHKHQLIIIIMFKIS